MKANEKFIDKEDIAAKMIEVINNATEALLGVCRDEGEAADYFYTYSTGQVDDFIGELAVSDSYCETVSQKLYNKGVKVEIERLVSLLIGAVGKKRALEMVAARFADSEV